MIGKAVAGTALALGLFGSAWGGYTWLDTRYAQKADVQEVAARSKAYSDLEYYSRRVNFAEVRVELYCEIRPSPTECAYWKKQLRAEKAERERVLRK